jgi:uncharacterized membrane protein HdeD (DUF308 family)
LRRTLGVLLIIAGGVLMWLAPTSAFTPQLAAGLVLLLAGILLEIAGIALEHRDQRKKPGRAADP